ncbi:efflux RND transporter periplasmic adaptor subunit [Parapedobacter sp. 2B3]|uniref:efflux RND transporter periplasmic adaptor subunit n=1 Tax=Parapedobacter sp. 2B3 TaxID=3342381 RepID=UPI0035B5DFD1
MQRTINKLFFGVLMAASFTLLYRCTNQPAAGGGHDHGTPSETSQAAHDTENTVTLTDEQLKTVGIEIGSVELKQLSATMKANGFLRVPNTNKANVTSLFGGIVKTLDVEIGDDVKRGQAIATVSNPQFIQPQEEYLRLNSDIEFAEQELTRQQDLSEGDVGAKKNLQRAVAELNTLKTRKASLQQQLQLMGIHPASLSITTLRSSLVVASPINGTVSEVFAKIGSYVDVSSPIAELVENRALHLDLQVFEKDIPSIKVGQKIDFVVTNSPHKTYVAEVYNIGSSFNSESKTIAIHCKVIGDKTGLIDGMNITGTVDLGGEASVAVPNDAIVNADGRYYIFLVSGEEEEPHEHGGEEHDHGLRFEKMEVMKGAAGLGYTAITPVREIVPGTPIVVKGAFFVYAKMGDTGEHGHAH